MSLTEYDEEAVKRTFIEEGREEGIQQKAQEGAEELLKEKISPEIIARCLKLPLEQVLDLKNSIEVHV